MRIGKYHDERASDLRGLRAALLVVASTCKRSPVLAVVKALAVAWALVLGVRARSVLGVCSAIAILALLAGQFAVVVVLRGEHALPALFAFVVLFFGVDPLTVPLDAAHSFFVRAIANHPYCVPILSIAISAVCLFVFARRAAPLRPEVEEARKWERLGRPFTVIVVCEGLLLATTLLMEVVTRGM